jgi:hypothetical protein
MLEELACGIWTVDAPLTLGGAKLGTRMTVVRLPDGGLALIAPIEIDDALSADLAELGPSNVIIAPNAFHHFSLLAAVERYPQATCFLAEGVEGKVGSRPTGAKDLSASPDALWAGTLEQVVIAGAPAINEIVFLHTASKTLILTDLCFNFDPAPSGWTGLFLRLAGAHGRLAVTRLMRTLLKDRDQVRASIASIKAWDFENLIVAHGHNMVGGARERFAAATEDV